MAYNFGICEWSFPVSGVTAIRLASEAGFAGMQLSEAGGVSLGFPLGNERVRAIYLEEAEKSGVRLHSLNLGDLLASGNIKFAPESPRGKQAMESLRQGFSAAEKLGLYSIVVTVDPESDEALENTVAHVRYAAELSRESGVKLALEFGVKREVCERLLESVGTPDLVYVCLDTLNPLRFGIGDAIDDMRYFGRDKIEHFHVKDCPAELMSKKERGNCLLGEGAGRFREAVYAIKEMEKASDHKNETWIFTENRYFLPPLFSPKDDFTELAKKDLETLKGA